MEVKFEPIAAGDGTAAHDLGCPVRNKATQVAVCGGFRIACCEDQRCQERAKHVATSFARAKKETDQWKDNPGKAAEDLKEAAARLI